VAATGGGVGRKTQKKAVIARKRNKNQSMHRSHAIPCNAAGMRCRFPWPSAKLAGPGVKRPCDLGAR
jgi:hypothetical protein